MKCNNCKKNIDPERAVHCSSCDSVFCETCAELKSMCDCYGDLNYYN